MKNLFIIFFILFVLSNNCFAKNSDEFSMNIDEVIELYKSKGYILTNIGPEEKFNNDIYMKPVVFQNKSETEFVVFYFSDPDRKLIAKHVYIEKNNKKPETNIYVENRKNYIRKFEIKKEYDGVINFKEEFNLENE